MMTAHEAATDVPSSEVRFRSKVRRKTGCIVILKYCLLSYVLFLTGWNSAHAEERNAKGTLPPQIAKFDINGDGKLSQSELPGKTAPQLIKRFDKNNDQMLDAKELMAFVKARREKGKTTTTEPESKVRILTNIAYVNGGNIGESLQSLDLYLPSGSKDFPVLFWIHGGGLYKGDKSKTVSVAECFARHGYGVVSVNYRLSPAVKYPAHIEDVATAFRWTYDKIGNYGGDRKRLFVTGGSAGGHLAILLALDEKFLKSQGLTSKDIRAVLPISGLMDVSRSGQRRIETVWGGDSETVTMASPLSHVRADAPPTLIMYADGEKEDRAAQNREMYEMLKKVGLAQLEIKELKNRTHSTIRPNLAKEDDPGLLAMLRFMEKHDAQAKAK